MLGGSIIKTQENKRTGNQPLTELQFSFKPSDGQRPPLTCLYMFTLHQQHESRDKDSTTASNPCAGAVASSRQVFALRGHSAKIWISN
ncbi:hypothetical protein J6590_037613 [Homalodisca vitripennis]|nr:hypothetical protein J6590_037613 [Homalodisca vitripennis]